MFSFAFSCCLPKNAGVEHDPVVGTYSVGACAAGVVLLSFYGVDPPPQFVLAQQLIWLAQQLAMLFSNFSPRQH